VTTREDVMVALDAFLESEPLKKCTQPGKWDIRVRAPKYDILVQLFVLTYAWSVSSTTAACPFAFDLGLCVPLSGVNDNRMKSVLI